ncbi:Zinc finger C3HC4 type (RING finger)/Ring finger domain containing protein [Lotmaria passim]
MGAAAGRADATYNVTRAAVVYDTAPVETPLVVTQADAQAKEASVVPYKETFNAQLRSMTAAEFRVLHNELYGAALKRTARINFSTMTSFLGMKDEDEYVCEVAVVRLFERGCRGLDSSDDAPSGPASPFVVRAIPRHVLTEKLARALSSSEHIPDTSRCTVCCCSFVEIVNSNNTDADSQAIAARQPSSRLLAGPPPYVMLFPCSHAFCSSCALTWLQKSRECPNCRRLVEDSVARRSKVSKKLGAFISPAVMPPLPKWWTEATHCGVNELDRRSGTTGRTTKRLVGEVARK